MTPIGNYTPRRPIPSCCSQARQTSQYVADGAAPVCITGLNQVEESKTGLIDLLELEFGQCQLVLAASKEGGIKSVKDIASVTVATELPNIARAYFAKRGISPDIAEFSGMTELTPHVDISDAIIDITSVDLHSRGTASLSSTWYSNRRYVCCPYRPLGGRVGPAVPDGAGIGHHHCG